MSLGFALLTAGSETGRPIGLPTPRLRRLAVAASLWVVPHIHGYWKDAGGIWHDIF